MSFLQVSLGIHLRNENKTDEMAEIMEHLQQYVPSKRTTESFVMPGSEEISLQIDHFGHILFGGDQLTVARARGAQRIMSNSHNGFDRLEGLVPVVEDWHAKVTFMKVIFLLYVFITPFRACPSKRLTHDKAALGHIHVILFPAQYMYLFSSLVHSLHCQRFFACWKKNGRKSWQWRLGTRLPV